MDSLGWEAIASNEVLDRIAFKWSTLQTVADLKSVQGLREVFIPSLMNVIQSVKGDENQSPGEHDHFTLDKCRQKTAVTLHSSN